MSEIGIPEQLMTADDCDNLDYAKEFGQYLVKATVDVDVIILSMPEDLVAGANGNEGQYEFRLWELHVSVINAFKRGQYTEVRFAHSQKHSEVRLALDFYQMHNVDRYIKRMLVGEPISDALWTKSLRLIQSQRYPNPPSTIDDKDTFAILHAIDYDAWTEAGYSIAFTQPHEWETGSVLALQRTLWTIHALSGNCELAASWWLDRFAFCTGNGFWESYVMHGTASCPRGGRDERQWNLGKQIFGKNLKARTGCSKCACPYGLCARPARRENSQRSPPSSECPFGWIIYDVVVGLCQSECYFYRESLALEMRWENDDDGPTDWDLTFWLGAPMPGREEIASQFVGVFLMWTRAAREQLDKREIQRGYRHKGEFQVDYSGDEMIDWEIEEIHQAG